MVAPLVPLVGKSIASAGIFEGARRGLPRVATSLRSAGGRFTRFLGSSKGTAAGGGALGGYGYADVTNRLGIEDSRIDLLVYGGMVLAVIYVVGQLFDIQLGGS